MFDKLAYFLNGDINTIDSYAALEYSRIMMAEQFSKLPDEIDTMNLDDYIRNLAISQARHEARQFNKDLEAARNL